MKTLKQLLHHHSLEHQTSLVTWERGQAYFAQDRIVVLAITPNRLVATVRGSQLYEVNFWRKGNVLQFSCTCPFATKGGACKHCVAVALTFQQDFGQ